MDDNTRNTLILFSVIFLVLMLAIVIVGVSVYRIARDSDGLFEDDIEREKIPFVLNPPGENSNEQEEDPGYIPPVNASSYSFPIYEEGHFSYPVKDKPVSYSFNVSKVYKFEFDENTQVQTGVKDESLVEEVKTNQAGFSNVTIGSLSGVEIPKISVKAPILQGGNGDELLDRGWWLYPASYVDQPGEKILYCHRRFFGKYDPRTCWYVEKLENEDEIYVYTKEGEKFTYKVFAKSIVTADLTVSQRPSTRDYLKIITCSTATGAPGSDEFRLIILAKLIE